jgi:hypothetical protein
MDHPLFFLAYRRVLIFFQEWFFYYLLLNLYYNYNIHKIRYLIPLLIGGSVLIIKEYINLETWENQMSIHDHQTNTIEMMNWQYLSFRHTMVSLDTWLFVALLAWMIYIRGERSLIIIIPATIIGIIFNLTGYYYLHLLEMNYVIPQSSSFFSSKIKYI